MVFYTGLSGKKFFPVIFRTVNVYNSLNTIMKRNVNSATHTGEPAGTGKHVYCKKPLSYFGGGGGSITG